MATIRVARVSRPGGPLEPDAILVHPTMAEGLARLFRALPARP